MDNNPSILIRFIKLLSPRTLRRLLITLTFGVTAVAFSAEPHSTIEGAYTINTQMIMPNLEESLRYANSTVILCVKEFKPDQFFPILKHQSLAGCTLKKQTAGHSDLHYTLDCTGTNQTLGNAKLTHGKDQLKGILNIRMGGKNMTFSQRIVAHKVLVTDTNCPVKKS